MSNYPDDMPAGALREPPFDEFAAEEYNARATRYNAAEQMAQYLDKLSAEISDLGLVLDAGDKAEMLRLVLQWRAALVGAI